MIIHFTKCKEGSTLASVRIAKYLSEKLDLPIFDEPNEALVQPYDLVVMVSSPSGFASPEMRDQVGEMCALARNYVFAQNDFMTSQAGQIYKAFDRHGRDRKRHLWTTIPKAMREGDVNTYVNWNQLTWDPQPRQKPQYKGLFYFGACRDQRIPYFQKFFRPEADYRRTISTTTRGAKKFEKNLGEGAAEYVGPMESFKDTAQYEWSLYLEDQYSNKHYTSPANRFYEVLSARVPQFFDRSCLGTFKEAALDIQKYLVDDHVDLARRMTANPEIVAEQQFQLWGRDYKEELDQMVNKAMEKLV